MTNRRDISHPGVEVRLPIDGETYRYEIPRETTLFLWRAIVPDRDDRIGPPQKPGGGQSQSCTELREQASLSISLAGETVSMIGDIYRHGQYRGVAWWTAGEPVELPATLRVEFELTGEQPTIDSDPVIYWTDDGQRVPWGEKIESVVHLQAPSDPEFKMHQEQLWDRHQVYTPRKC